MGEYRVCLQATVSVWVTVTANSGQEANRKAREQAPTVKGVKSWSPVMTCDMNRKF
jgi:hypothetical protein